MIRWSRSLGLFMLAASGIVGTAGAQNAPALTGTVIDAHTSAPLAGTQVEVLVLDSSFTTVSNEQGVFRFVALPSGIHKVRFSFVGYGSVLVPEVWLRLGRTEVLDVAMSPAAMELGEAVIEGVNVRYLTPLGSHALTVEKSLRYPATFFDPARLASTYAGVANTNDQANHFSVRGNGPSSNAWMLEGVEIVNPNHQTNAGTASDGPTLSGGGVNILSAQMLGTSQLLTGSLPTSYGNALGGIMDMQLRRGATYRRAHTLQAGLIGIDLSTEGPFKTGGKSSYLVNYRYSTLGILGAMGVDLGGERIGFQDLAFNVSMPINNGSISVFGIGGLSSNTFRADADSTTWEFDKDSHNINYSGRMGAAGATVRLAVGRNAVWRSTVALSANDQERTQEESTSDADPSRVFLSERKNSISTYLRGTQGARTSYQFGGSAMQRDLRTAVIGEQQIQAWLLRPYAQAGYAITEKLRAEFGVAYAYYEINGSSVWEPRALLAYRLQQGRSLSLSAGQRSQLPNVQFYTVGPLSGLNNFGVGPTRSQDLVLGYDHPISSHLVAHFEVFHQRLYDLPLWPSAGGNMVNAWDGFVNAQLYQSGQAVNNGVEASLVHTFNKNFFYQVNATVMNATFSDIDGDDHDSRWDRTAMGNLIIGREFVKEKEEIRRTWGLNGRFNVMGGQRVLTVDSTASAAFGTTAYSSTSAYDAQLATFYRIDLRVYLKREHKGRSGMWALDIQNLTGHRNEAFQYYDVRKGDIITKYQLGLIPNLSYRVEF